MQREDRSGIGSFGEECRSLEFEAQMRVNQEEATRKLYRLMSKYGAGRRGNRQEGPGQGAVCAPILRGVRERVTYGLGRSVRELKGPTTCQVGDGEECSSEQSAQQEGHEGRP